MAVDFSDTPLFQINILMHINSFNLVYIFKNLFFILCFFFIMIQAIK